ncbi:hypothetical protein ASPZODRAFT_142285 [Penicilliopsis zonata CBS 506.65]|uniref:Aminoglycoside phosphotransferase domain-containing protein n=1 Tax=Penicilliopsis zonata CBS 506.65 TaxID=1073090 RepID=A0A1L9SH45_9EURO|nr:hypothetical protein ASPZODRAFT_142285 [Penicilliopsis zonata CBS 506.65]OJJ46471.1 hypothetical protein ASPZODRAFT_142285 [Penicilliopsis zonata CBS 506.65]
MSEATSQLEQLDLESKSDHSKSDSTSSLSDSTNSQSDSSTLVYSQEPFETFKLRALKLCEAVLGAAASGEVSIERMRGGGFNRVIAVSVAGHEDGNQESVVKQYILRIPRFEIRQIVDDLAPLQLLRQESTIQIPHVVKFDATQSNALEQPYMIMMRISGSPLWPGYPDLSQELKCAIAKDLGAVYLQLHSIRSVTAGRITSLPCPEDPSKDSLRIQPLDRPAATDSTVPYEKGPAAQTVFDTIHAILQHQKDLATAMNPSAASFRIELYDQFLTIASEMDALGILAESGNCLCHRDLEPRNIMAHAQGISGILDWDSAIFAPLVMSCAPPMWLWAWNEEDEEDERLAGDIPSAPESRQLKELFEQAAGPTYLRFAYGAQYRLARTLIHFAIDGIQVAEDLDRADLLQSEWDEVRKLLESAKVAKEDE